VCLAACQEAMRRGGLAPAAANGANEKAVELFLAKKIRFLDIGQFVWEAMERQPKVDSFTVEDVLACDRAAREYVAAKAGIEG
ncbi:MAG: 1-deoxy-D-xylulose-5-phosphate reductoisomerase, partial [Clostridia bacterium]|nr:1-deoxy-D-xylulose-5-phosphate reductoisomerase [Clostridia bacterium]